MFDKLKLIGKISRPFGIRGQVKLDIDKEISFLDSLDNKKVYIKSDLSYEFFFVEKDQIISKKRILTLKDVSNIEDIEPYVGCYLYTIKGDVAIETEINYHGWKVLYQDNDFGIVVDVIYNGKYNLLKVEQKDSKYIWIPNIDNFVKKTLKSKKTIYVQNIEEF
ncbi:hypothetical protein [Spiroplasma endosymbiont of Aspidapion aeneum]|uniref:ribosome maturation factor RimM n=1 Tax=Spiroplasma endosymbiont of Aspidapion aeneum TaxID=3066276 RepID=UPI00313C8AE9